MDITQDDLWTLRHLRAAIAGGAAADASEAALAQWPGRAEGRVAAWSFSRAATILRRAGRRAVTVGQGLAPTADEAALLRVVRCLTERDWQGAEDAALWLVRRDAARDLAQALAPATCAYGPAYGKAAPRRAQAASA
jgi:hypothetical protein